MSQYKPGIEARHKIIEVAKKLFYNKGYDDVSIVSICKEADISRTAFFYYFKDKAELADCICNEIHLLAISNNWKSILEMAENDNLVCMSAGAAILFNEILRDPNILRFYSQVLRNNSDMLIGNSFYRDYFLSYRHAANKTISDSEFELFYVSITSAPGNLLHLYSIGKLNVSKDELIKYIAIRPLTSLGVDNKEVDRVSKKSMQIMNSHSVNLSAYFNQQNP